MLLLYTRNGDIYLPDLSLPEDILPTGKYGFLRRDFLKEHKRGLYSSLLLTGKLDKQSEIDCVCTPSELIYS